MPTANDQKLGFFIAVLVLYALVSLFDCLRNNALRKKEQEQERKRLHAMAVRASVKNGRHGDYPANEVLTQLWHDMRYQIQEIADMTNWVGRESADEDFEFVPTAYKVIDRTMERLYRMLHGQSDERYVSSTAFVFASLTRQLKDLERQKGYVSVSVLCTEMIERVENVNADRRRFAFEQEEDGIGFFCRAFKDQAVRIANLQNKRRAANGYPVKSRRRR